MKVFQNVPNKLNLQVTSRNEKKTFKDITGICRTITHVLISKNFPFLREVYDSQDSMNKYHNLQHLL